MDEIDTKIINLLQQNGRTSNAALARNLAVSEGTVRRRLRNLIGDGYIHVVAVVNPGKMGFTSEALLGVQVDPDKIDSVSADLSSLKEISWVSVTTGTYDVFAWAILPSAEDLGVFLRTKVGTINGVRKTETFVNLHVKKRGQGMTL